MSLNLHEPIAGFRPTRYPDGDVMQFFGENHDLYSKSVCYGPPINQCLQGHNGWDITRAWGAPILCVQGGKVVEVQEATTGFGKSVRVLTNDSEWVYGHMSSISVSQGQNINAGDQIGLMGNTGFVVSGATPYWKLNPYAGTHLHLGRKAIIPYTNQSSWGLYPTGDKVELLNGNNGYFGAVSYEASDFVLQGPFYEDLSFGSFGFRVKLWQKVLIQEGVATFVPTGFFGPQTRTATLALQKKYGIDPVGRVGPTTRTWANAKYPTLA